MKALHSPLFSIREASPDDAEALIAYIKRLLGEPDIHLVGTPAEFTMTVEKERKFIADMHAADNSALFVAEAEGRIIGDISCRGETRLAKRHVGVVGISVAEGWRDQGVGSALMHTIIGWARRSGALARLELMVFAANERAVHLYQKYGFEIEGVKRRAIYKYETFWDEYIMALLLDGDRK